MNISYDHYNSVFPKSNFYVIFQHEATNCTYQSSSLPILSLFDDVLKHVIKVRSVSSFCKGPLYNVRDLIEKFNFFPKLLVM